MLASSKTLKMKENDQEKRVVAVIYPTFHNEVICKDLLEKLVNSDIHSIVVLLCLLVLLPLFLITTNMKIDFFVDLRKVCVFGK